MWGRNSHKVHEKKRDKDLTEIKRLNQNYEFLERMQLTIQLMLQRSWWTCPVCCCDAERENFRKVLYEFKAVNSE